MYAVECKNSNLFVTLNGKQVIRHTPAHPFAVVGVADPVTGAVKERAVLTSAEFDETRAVIRFSGGQSSMSFSLSMQNNTLLLTPQRTTIGVNRVWLSFPANPGEAVYGGGMQRSSLNLRGRKYPVWVSTRGHTHKLISSQPMSELHIDSTLLTAFPQPTFVNAALTFVHLDSPARMLMDFTGSRRHRVEIWDLPAHIILGAAENADELFKSLSALFGRQAVLPSWCMSGAWLEIEGGQHRMVEQLEKAVTGGVTVSALIIRDWTGSNVVNGKKETFWDWILNPGLYPKLYALTRELLLRNVRVLAYINPHLSIEGRLFAEASSKGYLIKKPAGGNYLSDMGGFMAGHIDLTNPAACDFYKKVIAENILNPGFSGYIADMGNFLPHDAVLFNKDNPKKIHNEWPLLWAKLNKEALREAGKSSEAVFFTRSGFSCLPTYSPISWTGNHKTGWGRDGGLASALISALSLSWSGVCVSHSEIGGGAAPLFGKRSRELMMRWCELAALSPVMRMSDGTASERNCRFDSDRETLAHFAKMSRLHAGLEPYLRAVLKDSATNGIPAMRPLSMLYPKEKVFVGMFDEFMLGPDLLAAPLIWRGRRSRKVILPEGNWVHIWSGKTYQKGEHDIDAPIGRPPAFYLENSKFAALFSKIVYDL